jgi:hypothetical protein
VTVTGDKDGTASVELFDQANANSDTYLITTGDVSRDYFGTLTHSFVSSITLHAGNGDNVFDVASGQSGNTTTLFAGAGNDLVAVGSNRTQPGASTLNASQGNLIVHGEGNTATGDTIVLLDAGSTVGRTMTLDATTIVRTGGGTVTFDTVEKVSIEVGGSADTIGVKATAAGTTTTLLTNGGSDTIRLGSIR